MNDATSPNHYARFKIQPFDFLLQNRIGFCEGNVIKYVCRYDAKNGLEDLKKARVYLDKLIKAEEAKLVEKVRLAAEAKKKAKPITAAELEGLQWPRFVHRYGD